MANQSLSNRPDFQAKLPRTDHNVGQTLAFTSSVGHLLPVYNQFMNVGETMYFTPNLFGRTQPMLNAAIADVDVYLDTFFVPLQMLFNAWDSIRYQTNDPISSLWASRMNSSLPFPDFNLIKSCYPTDTEDFNITRDSFINETLGITTYNQLLYDDEYDCRAKEMLRLFDLLNLPRSYAFKNSPLYPRGGDMSVVNAFYPALLAYQCIFQNHYRLDDWERKNVESYNIDNPYISSNGVAANIKMPFATMIQYRPWHMDSFTSLKNGPLASFVNLVGGSSVSGVNILQNLVNYLQPGFVPSTAQQTSDGGVSPSPSLDNSFVVNNQSGSASAILRTSTASIRSIFAYEKLVRIFGRTAKDYDSQVLAHFGFKVPHDVKHELTHICQQHSIIHIGEVISTSDTVSGEIGSALGAIGGKGYGVINSKKPYRFTAPVDGVFMCCYSSAPRQRYFGTFDKQNTIVDRMSLFQPEYDKLGMQPLFSYESAGFRDDGNDGRIGWQYRYEQWKRKYNRVSEAFAAPGIYDQVINNNVSWVNATRPFASAFGYAPASVSVGENGSGLFVQPTDINQIMIVPYEPTMPDEAKQNAPVMFYTDPFIHAYRANVKKVSVMSSFGEPDLNGI